MSRDVYRQLRCTDHDDDGAASPPCKKFQLEADLRLELKTGSENHMDITWMTGALPSSGTPKVLLNQGKQNTSCVLASMWKFFPPADIPDPYPVDHGATLYNQLRQNDYCSRNNTRIEV